MTSRDMNMDTPVPVVERVLDEDRWFEPHQCRMNCAHLSYANADCLVVVDQLV